MKSTKGPTKEFLQKGPLANLPWTKVSRRSAPLPGSAPEGDVAYGVRSSEDIVRGFGRRDKSSLR